MAGANVSQLQPQTAFFVADRPFRKYVVIGLLNFTLLWMKRGNRFFPLLERKNFMAKEQGHVVTHEASFHL